MRYSQINKLDISNGEGIGVCLYTTGCRFYCKNCFNKELWDINGGKKWDRLAEEEFINLASNQFIERISILGGEPLIDENLNEIYYLLKKIKTKLPTKSIWIYTGYTWEQIIICEKKKKILPYIDILVDGLFVEELKDLTLKWRGSKNQRVIDVQSSIKNERIVNKEEEKK